MVEAGAALAPTFLVVSLTVMVRPAPASLGAARLVSTRSAPIWRVREKVLFASCISAMTLSASALAKR